MILPVWLLVPLLALLVHGAAGTTTNTTPTRDFKDGVIVAPGRVYLQKGRTQRLTCPALSGQGPGPGPGTGTAAPAPSAGDALVIAFHRVTATADGSPRWDLVLRYAHPLSGGNFSAGPRYRFAPDFGLVIAAVDEPDGGGYLCRVVLGQTARNVEGSIEVTVLDDLFPADRGRLSAGRNRSVAPGDGASLTLSCPVNGTAGLHSPTVYWSEEIDPGAGAEAGAEAAETRIVATVFSDGESGSQRAGLGLSSVAGELVVSTAGDWRRRALWCHVSSEGDQFFLHSARIVLNKPEESRAPIALIVLIPLLVVFLIALGTFVCLRRARKNTRKRNIYISLPNDVSGPVIDAGTQVKWVHDFSLGPRGVIGGRGDKGGFDHLRSVQWLHRSGLAVLDGAGLHIFGDDFRRRALYGVQKLRQPAGNYAALAVQGSGERERIVLGTRDGTISCLDPATGVESVLCSLGAAVDRRGSGEEVEAEEEWSERGRARPDRLTDLAVDQAGNIYAGDEVSGRVAVFYSEGVHISSVELPCKPGLLAAGEADQFFAHGGDGGDQPVYRVQFTGGRHRTTVGVFANGQRLLHPINLVAGRGPDAGLFVVNDTRCQGQTEVLQFDQRGNYVRQFAKPRRGVRGLRSLHGGGRLAVYDDSVVSVYAKEVIAPSAPPGLNGP